MGKDKRPRKRRAPDPNPPEDQEPQRQTQEKADLLPPARRPPTAVAAETPPLPPRPPRAQPAVASTRPVLWQLLQGLRTAIGVMLDAADAAADTIRQRLESSH
jgi:hypothetical protein